MAAIVSTVTNEAQLDNDIQIIDGTTVASIFTIDFGASIPEDNLTGIVRNETLRGGSTLSVGTFPDLSAIDLHSGVTLATTGGIDLNAGIVALTAAGAAGTGTITFGSGTGDSLAFPCATDRLFPAAAITGANSGSQSETATITLSNAGSATDAGTMLPGTGPTRTGTYSLITGTPSAVTTALDGLTFSPMAQPVAPGSTSATGMVVSVFDGIAGSPTTDQATTVIASAASVTAVAGELYFTVGNNVPTAPVNRVNQIGVNGATVVGTAVDLIDGSQQTFGGGTTVISLPGIAVDPAAGKFFITDTNSNATFNKIWQGGIANAGTALTQIASTATTTTQVQGLAIDEPNGNLYYALNNTTSASIGIYKIGEAGGSATEVVGGFTSTAHALFQIALDMPDNLVFFADSPGLSSVSTLWAGNLLSHTETALTTSAKGARLEGVAFNNGTVYWSTLNGGTIANNNIFSSAITVTGSGSLATASIGTTSTLYAGAATGNGTIANTPISLAVDPVTGILYSGSNIISGGTYFAVVNAGTVTGGSSMTPIFSSAFGGTASSAPPTLALTFESTPTIAPGGSTNFTIGGAAITVAPTAAVTDPSGFNLAGATVAITGGTFTNDGDTLTAITAGTSILANFSGETLTLSGDDTLAHYKQVLDSVAFKSTAADPGNGGANPTRTVSWTVTDGVIASTTLTNTININHAPTITGTASGQTVNDNATDHPFSGVTISDPDTSAAETVTITLKASGTASDADGLLSGSGLTKTGTGTYTLTTSTPAAVSTASDALTFTPTAHQVAPGSTVTTGMVVSVTDGIADSPTTDSATTVIATAVTASPTLVFGQTIDVAGVLATTETVAAGTMTLLNGGTAAGTIVVGTSLSTSDFVLKADGSGGTEVIVSSVFGTYSAGITLTSQNNNSVNVTGAGRITSSSSLYDIYGPGGGSNNWTVSNSGTLIDNTNLGVAVAFGSSSTPVTNGVFTNQSSGLITSVHNDVAIQGPGTITNMAGGTIISTATGEASAIYSVGGTIVNGGLVQAANVAIYETAGVSVTNLATGTIAGAGGVYLEATSTVTNAGTITGTDPAYGAVTFVSASGANRLIVDPGAVFNGKLLSLPSSTNVIELASGASAGTLAGFDGTTITNFASLAFDTGAAWTVKGTSGASGLGSIAITGFAQSDTIDLTGFVAVSDTFGSNVVTFTNAATQHATLHLQGSFSSGNLQFASDGSGGTDITGGTTLTLGHTITGTYTTGLTLTSTANSNPFTVTGKVSVTSGIALTGIGGDSWTITNSGTLLSTFGQGKALLLGNFTTNVTNGVLTNKSGGLISAPGTLGYGVFFYGPGSVTNQLGGTITAGHIAVEFNSSTGTIVNYGVMLASSNVAAYEREGGIITNLAGGTISGSTGVWFQYGAGTFTNAGTVIGTSSQDGAVLFNDQTSANLLIVDPGAVFSGAINGGLGAVQLASSSSTGTLSGFNGTSIVNFGTLQFDAGSKWTVSGSTSAAGLGSIAITGFAANDTIDLNGFIAISDTFGSNVVTFTNAATQHATLHLVGSFSSANLRFASDGSTGSNIYVGTQTLGHTLSGTYTSTVTLTSPANNPLTVLSTGKVVPTATAGSYGALYGKGAGQAWTITNAGSLNDGTNGNGIQLGSGGTYVGASSITNQTGGIITGAYGIRIYNTVASSVVNQAGGTITATTDRGVYFNASSTLTNFGVILAPTLTSQEVGVLMDNGGTIINNATGTISGYGGVVLIGTGTVTNAGTIKAVNTTEFAVVLDSGGTSRLIVDPGAVFVGQVYGGFGTLELASAVTAGTLSAASFTDFNTVKFDAGSSWTLIGTAPSTINTSTALHGTIQGFTTSETIDVLGFAAVSATYASGVLTLTNAATAHTTLHLSGGSLTTGNFMLGGNGTSSTYLTFGIPLAPLIYGQTIDETGVIATTETVVAGTMTLKNGGGTVVGTLSVGTSLSTGDFNLTSDGSGGTDVIVTTVFGTYANGVTLRTVPTTIASTASVNGTANGVTGVYGTAGTAWNLTNQSFIDETGNAAYGISFAGGGTITNASGGAIYGSSYGIRIDGGPAAVTNLGRIEYGAHNGGIFLLGGGSVINGAATSGSSAASISGHYYGVRFSYAGNDTVTNYGTILAPGGNAVSLFAGSVVNGSGGATSALIDGIVGIRVSGTSGTITNFGTIASNAGTAGHAINFGTGANRLIVEPGAVFIGSISGGTGPTAVVELASGSSAGTLSGFGTSITNFGSLVFDSGAQWKVTGNGSANGLGTLGITGFTFGDTIDLTGFVATSRTFANGALVLTDAGATHETLAVAGTFTTANVAIAGDGTGGTDISLQDVLAYGETIDQTGIVAATETVTAGTMTLKNGGGTVAGTIVVGTSLSTGDFILNSDGSGGTDVIVSTVFGTYTNGVTLLTNPTTIASTAQVGNTAASGAAVSGLGGTTWTLTNLGTVSEIATGGTGISFAGAGTIINSGQVAGNASTVGGAGVVLGAGGSLTNQPGGTVAGYFGIVVHGAAATVVNAASIAGAGYTLAGDGRGVYLGAGGRVTNQASGRITGYFGVTANNTAATVVNFGAIYGQVGTAGGGEGVYLGAGGSVTNQSSATIKGLLGVEAQHAAGTVVNAGGIFGDPNVFLGRDIAVYLSDGGSVTNQSGGTLGGYEGILAAIDAISVVNTGAITGDLTSSQAAGIYLLAGGSVSNLSGGTVSGQNGVYAKGAATTVLNAGGITGDIATLGSGVYLGAGGSVSNQSGGTIGGYFGVKASNVLATVLNAGVIAGNYVSSAQNADGVYLSAGGSVTNQAGGAIYGRNDGVLITGAPGTVLNLGTIHSHNPGYGGRGVSLDAGGLIVNGASGGTASTSMISGYNYAVQFGSAGTDTLINYGTINGLPGTVAVAMTTGTLINGPSGATGALIESGAQNNAVLIGGAATVINYGSIIGSEYYADTGIFFGISLAGNGSVASTIGNLGASALITNYVAVYAGQNATLTNAGTLEAAIQHGGTANNAVIFGGGTNRLIIDPGAVFIGTVSGSGAVTLTPTIGSPTVLGTANGIGITTLELASATSAGTLNGLGENYAGFAAVTIDSGAQWTIAGYNTLAPGITLTDSGTLTGSGTLINAGLITGAVTGIVLTTGARLTNKSGGTITGSGVGASASGAATVLNAGVISDSPTVVTDAGVLLAAGGSVTNQSGGTISGHYGVLLVGGGSVTNLAGGTITGSSIGVSAGGAATVVNAGVISDVPNTTKNAGVLLAAGGSVTNQSGGTISGYYGVLLKDGGSVTNQSGGTISGAFDGLAGLTIAATVINAGVLSSTNTTAGDGIFLSLGGSVTNQAGGTISGANGLYADSSLVTVVNAGTMAGTSTLGSGVDLEFGGSLTNQTGGAITGVWGVSAYDGSATVVNAGGITANPTSIGAGVYLRFGGTATNQSGGTIRGPEGIYARFVAATVVNAGSIGGNSTSGIGVLLQTGGTVTNRSGGSISGGIDSVKFGAGHTNRLVVDSGATFTGIADGGNTIGATSISTLELAAGGAAGTLTGLGSEYIDFAQVNVDAGAVWTLGGSATGFATLANAGSIAGGVTIGAGSFTVSNQSSGTIAGTTGISASGTVSVVNAGHIGGGTVSGGVGVSVSGGSAITNQVAGTIAGFGGVYVSGAVSVANAGYVGGNSTSGVGVSATAGGSVTNQAGGTIRGADGIRMANATGIVLNTGLISGYGSSGGHGVILTDGGSVTNQAAGTITGNQAVNVRGATLTLTNAGSIGGNGTLGSGAGVIITDGGTVTNQASANITGFNAVEAVYPGDTLVNAGRLAGNTTSGRGVYLQGGGSITNQVSGTITGLDGINAGNAPTTLVNAGIITGGAAAGHGVYIGGAGSISNQAGAIISGFAGVVFYPSGTLSLTVANSGTIIGTGGTAVAFGAGAAGRLIDAPGAVFTGAIYGGSADNGILELTSAAGAGSISGLGGTVTNFGSVVFDDGARWTVTGNDAADGLGTLGISGFTFGDTIDLTGIVAVSRTFASNSLVLTDGGGAHATLAIQGSFATSSFRITADGSGGTDIVEQSFLVYAQTIDTPGILATSETVTAGAMTLFNGGGTAVGTIAVGTSLSSGDFSLNPDGSGGTDAIVHTAAGTYTSGVTLLVNPTTIGSLATISGTVASGIGVNGPSGTYWSVTNLGQISETGSLSIGISLAIGGRIDNATGANIAGALDGVSLSSGGSVTNQSGATITGFSGIYAVGGRATVMNTGSIGGNVTAGAGVKLVLGGTVANLAGGTISGGYGILALPASSTVVNAGSIGDGTSLSTGTGIALRQGGTITNQTGGRIIAGLRGIAIGGGTPGASPIPAYGLIPVYGPPPGATATIINAGSIGGGSTSGDGIVLASSAVISNQSGGVITGDYGIRAVAAAVTVFNLGSIGGNPASAGGTGIYIGYLGVAGAVTNQTGGTITGFRGVVAVGGQVANQGGIAGNATSANGVAVQLQSGAALNNQTGGTLTGYTGVYGSSGTATVVNAGSIGGNTFSGTGVYLAGGGTITNQTGGTISAGVDAVKFGAGFSNRLVVDPGSRLIGSADGGNTIGATSISTLELAPGAGTIGGLGGHYINFAQVTIDAAASWEFAGANTLHAGVSLTNSGTLTDTGILYSAGTISGDKLILSGGQLTNLTAGLISAAYVYGTSSGGTDGLVNQGTISAASNIGVYFKAGGNVTNTAEAEIRGYDGGVKLHGSNATVTNLGEISGTGANINYGIYMRNGGLVTNGQAGTDFSDAYIQGYYGIAFKSVDTVNASGTLINYGRVVGSYAGGAGVELANAGTVINGQSGVTLAAIYGSRYGVSSGEGPVFNFATIMATGTASGSYGIAIQGTGSVSNLGTSAQIGGYAGVLIGTDGTVTNSGTIASNLGTIGVAVKFTDGNARLIDNPGAVFIGSIFGGTGGTAVLELASASSAGTIAGLGATVTNFTSLVFDPGADWTVIAGSATHVLGTMAISGFAAGDTIDMPGIATTSRTFANNALVLTGSGGKMETLDILGNFSTSNFKIASDGDGGTDVTFQTPPTIVAGGTVIFQGGGSPVALDTGLTTTDLNSATLASGTISINAGFTTGDTLNFVDQNGISGVYDGSTGTLTLTGTATIANYQAALASITYGFSPADGDPTNGGGDTSRTLAWQVSDGITVSNTGTSTLQTVHVAPTITASGTVTFTGGGAPVLLDPTVSVGDPDSLGLLSGGTVMFAGLVSGDILSANTTGTAIIESFDTSTGVLTLSGSDTLADYQAVLRSVAYSVSPSNRDPTANGAHPGRVIDWQLSDGVSVSNTGTSTLTEVRVAPTLSVGGTVTFTGGGAPVILDPGLTASDIDSSGDLSGATISIVSGLLTGDLLNFTNQNGITGVYNGTTGTLALSGSATIANYRTALASITYSVSPVNGDPTGGVGDASRTIDWIVNDGVSVSNTGASTVLTVHSAPTIGASGTVSFTGGGAAVLLDPSLTVSDTDSGGVLTGATISVGPFVTGDLLNFVDQNGITGFYNTTNGILSLFGSATIANYETALASITYSVNPGNLDPTHGGGAIDRTIDWQVSDGVAVSNTGTSSVTVVHAAPVIVAGGTVIFTGGGSAVVLDAGIGIGDPDSSGNLTGATITVGGPFDTGDSLNFVNQNGIAGAYDAGTGTLTLSGTTSIANYQTALASITYSVTPGNLDPTHGGGDTSRTIDWQVSDGAAVSNTGTSTVTDVHVAPTIGASGTVTFLVGGGAVLPDGAIALTDPDSSGMLNGATVSINSGLLSGDTLNFVNQNGITGAYNPGTGTLTLSGTASLANYEAALDSITYSSSAADPAGGGGDASRTISWSASDGVVNSGVATTSLAIVFPPPSITGAQGGQSVTDAATLAPFAGVSISDIHPGQSETVTVTLSNHANGVLSNLSGGSYNSSTGVYSISGNAAAVSAALDDLIFTPTAHQATPGNAVLTTFTIGVTDTAGLNSSDSTANVTVTAVNDPPVIAGAVSGQITTDAAAIEPFAGVTISDPDAGAVETVMITLTAGDANGTLSGTGLTPAGAGTYALSSGTPGEVSAALRALAFTPTPNEVETGQTVTTGMTLSVSDGIAISPAVDATTSVVTTAVRTRPSIAGTVANQGVPDQSPSNPFATAALVDPNPAVADTMTVTLSAAGNGTLSDLSGGTYDPVAGVYSKTGTAAADTAALEALVFTPIAQPGSDVTTTGFTISPGDGGAADSTTSVTAVRQILGLAAVPANQIFISVSPDGSAFATALGGMTSEAVVTDPIEGGVYTVPVGYQALFLGGIADASLSDTIAGNALLVANQGNDQMTASAPNDILVAGSGDDSLFGGSFASTVVGGSGAATVFAGSGAMSVIEGSGPISFGGNSNAGSTIVGGSGPDAAALSANLTGVNQTVSVGSSAATITAAGSGNQVIGGDAPLSVTVTGTADTIQAGSGSSAIMSGGTGNLIVGGSVTGSAAVMVTETGNADTLAGSAAPTTVTDTTGTATVIFAGSGGLTFVGGTGTATVVGGTGPDQVTAGAGGVVFSVGASDNATVNSGAGAVTIFGAAGATVNLTGSVSGGAGATNYAVAGAGNETLNAANQAGPVWMSVSPSNDPAAAVLIAGSGSDTLIAGSAPGSVTMMGGSGSDAFVFFKQAAGNASDVIENFTASDSVFVEGYGPGSAGALQQASSVGPGGLRLTLSDGTTITFSNLTDQTALDGRIQYG